MKQSLNNQHSLMDRIGRKLDNLQMRRGAPHQLWCPATARSLCPGGQPGGRPLLEHPNAGPGPAVTTDIGAAIGDRQCPQGNLSLIDPLSVSENHWRPRSSDHGTLWGQGSRARNCLITYTNIMRVMILAVVKVTS